MTTTINADTVVGGAVVTADASGLLGLQAAGNTGLTLNSSRAIGVGASPSFGTAGQVLTSAGTGAAPTWTTPSAGAMVLISTTTASGSPNVIDITSGFSSTYDDYLILVENVTIGVVASAFSVRFYTASTLRTTLYMYSRFSFISSTTTGGQSLSTSTIEASSSVQTTSVASASFWIKNANSTIAGGTQVQGFVSCNDSTTATGNFQSTCCGANQSTSALTGIRIFMGDPTTTFLTGTFRLYGIAKS